MIGHELREFFLNCFFVGLVDNAVLAAVRSWLRGTVVEALHGTTAVLALIPTYSSARCPASPSSLVKY